MIEDDASSSPVDRSHRLPRFSLFALPELAFPREFDFPFRREIKFVKNNGFVCR